MPRLTKVCVKCRVERASSEFEKRQKPSGRPYRLSVCTTCKPNPERQRRGEGPWKADVACKQCGKDIWRKGMWCRVKQLKYCSDRCDRLARRKAFRKCERCERRLPFEAFDRPPTAAKHRHRNCRKCNEHRDRDKQNGSQRVGPAAMLKFAKFWAAKAQVPIALRIGDVRKIYDGDCYLCGKAPYSLQRLEKAKGYVPDNLIGLCLRCKTSVTKHGMDEVLVWSLEIASRHFKEQLVLPEHKQVKACEHCGELPDEAKQALARIEKQRAAIEDGEPQGATKIVAALHEHVL